MHAILNYASLLKYRAQFWKSQAMYWCDICKVWLKDDAQAKAVHERGAKHQENVAKRTPGWRIGKDVHWVTVSLPRRHPRNLSSLCAPQG